MAAPILGDMASRDDLARAEEGAVTTAGGGERDDVGLEGEAGGVVAAPLPGAVVTAVRIFGASPVLGLALVAVLASGPQLHAQDAKDRHKIEVVPTTPHTSWVQAVAFSPDGARVLSGATDDTIRLWDVATGALLRIFGPKAGGSVAFSPDGTRVLSSSGKTMRLWDAATGTMLRTFEGHSDTVYSVAFSPDGARVLSCGADNTIKLWDATTGELLRTFEGQSRLLRSVAFSPDGTRVLSGGSDLKFRIWDATTAALVRTFDAPEPGVGSVAFSLDGARVASSDWRGTINLWSAASGGLLRTFEGHSDGVEALALSPDGTRVLSSGSNDRTVRLWDATAGGLLRSFEGKPRGVKSVAFSPNGARVLSGGWAGNINLWDAATGALLRTFDGHSSAVAEAAYSPDGARMLSGHGDRAARLWDAATGALVRTLEGHSDEVTSVAYSPDGARVLSGSADKTIRLWDAATSTLLRTFEGHSDEVTSVAFSPDGARVLSGGADGKGLKNSTVKLWDAATAKLLRTFEEHRVPISSVAFSPDGTHVLSASADGDGRLWDVAWGAVRRKFSGQVVAFSPDGARVLSGSSSETVHLWDARTGAPLRIFRGHAGPVRSVVFSPGGARVLSGSTDGTVRLWDPATGTLLRTFQGHAGPVRSVAFSPDGRRILSAGKDTTLRIWDADTGAQVAIVIGGHDGRWLALTPAGFFAGSRSANDLLGIVRGFDITTIHQVHQSLFNPDLVREALAGDPNGEVAEAAKVINLEKVLDSRPAPGVVIEPPGKRGEATTDVISVTARIEDRGKGVGRIEWRVNGITAAVAARPPGRGPVYTVTRQLALDAGENTIEVVAYNGSNVLASLPAHTTVKFTGPADKTKPRLHILAIGINTYVDKGWVPPGSDAARGFGPLGLAVKDATAFADSMRRAPAGLYEEVRVTLALDEDASHANLAKLVDKVAAEIHPRDSFILFAAAHGDAEAGRFYLIPQDYQSGPPGTLRQRAIGQDDLQDWLANRIKARRAIVLLDTCESGALIAGHKRSRVDTAASEAGVGRLHEATGRPVLTAAAAGQAAGEGAIAGTHEGHGYFTWAVLDALRYGDANGNGTIELSELAAHVQSVVPKVAAGVVIRAAASAPPSVRQAARFGSRGDDFPVAKRLP
jgi:WD40 repeat protein